MSHLLRNPGCRPPVSAMGGLVRRPDHHAGGERQHASFWSRGGSSRLTWTPQKSARSGNAIGFGRSNPGFGRSSKRFKIGERMNTSNKLIQVMNSSQPSFRSILYRTIISHTVTYFVTGVVASILLGYATRMIRPDVAPIIRKITDPILIASPLFQPFRAALLAIVFYLLRDVLFSNRKGWLIMWCMLCRHRDSYAIFS
jgi:hypothetical protein